MSTILQMNELKTLCYTVQALSVAINFSSEGPRLSSNVAEI